MKNFSESLEKMKEQGYTISEEVTDVIQHFEVELVEENVMQEYPRAILRSDSDCYDVAQSRYILLDKNEDIVFGGHMEDIREYILENF